MSPILSLGEICSFATTFAGGRMDVSISEVSRYANMAYSEVRSRAGLKHTPVESIAISSTTTGENRIALPPDFDFATSLTLYVGSSSTASTSHRTSTLVLKPKDARWMDAQILANGEPQYYAVYGTSIEFYPSPNSAFSAQLRYNAQTPTLVASTDTPNLDERWHTAIAHKTAELTAASRGDVDNEALANRRYLSYVGGTRTDASDKQQDRTGMHLTFGSKTRLQ
jgi:hypothetical protein